MKAIQIISQDLFDKVRSRFSNLEMGDENGAITIDPADARFFDFDFVLEGNNLGRVSISLAELGSLKIYYSQGITENQDDPAKQLWYNFLKEMRFFAMRRLLRFDTRDISKTNLDRNDFQHLATTQAPKDEEMTNTMNESRWNHKSTKKTSRAVKGTTEVIVRHATAVDEMYPAARSQKKNIKAIFIQNKDGERFKYPFIHTAGAFAMAQHVDHGGVPHDPAGKAIIKMSEQIAQLQEFQKRVQRTSLHDDAMGITERAVGRLQQLKQQIEALGKRHHYESWIAEFNESDVDDGLSELDPVTLEDYKQKFTQTSFQEELASFFPLLHRIMSEENKIDLENYVNESDFDNTIQIDGKTVDPSTLRVDGVHRWDYPEFTDAFFEYGEFTDGTELTDDQLDKLGNEHGDLLNQKALDSLHESGQSGFSKFEDWAESVVEGQQEPLTKTQVDGLQAAIKNAEENGQPLEMGEGGQTAWDFFTGAIAVDETGPEWDTSLQDMLAKAADVDSTANPLEVFQLWAKENYPGILTALGMESEEEPVPQEPVAQEPVAAPAPDVPAKENDDMTWTNNTMPAMEGKDKMYSMVAELVKSRFNASNPEVGPFNGHEGILIDVKKEISEKFGEAAGEQARQVAELFMEKLTKQWEAKHGKPDDDGLSLARLKELFGRVKAKVETIDPKNPKDYEIPAYMRKQQGQAPLTPKDIDDKDNASPTTRAGLEKKKAQMGISENMDEILRLAGLAK